MKEKSPIKAQARWKLIVSDGPYAGEYPTVVEGVSGDRKSVTVGMPISKGEVVPLPVGTRVRVHQSGQAVYVFDTVVTGHTKDAVPLLIVKAPDKITRIQRRNYVRMTMSAGVPLEIMEPDGTANAFGEVRLVDLSAGGVGIVSRREIAKGTVVRLVIPFLEKRIVGEVVRVRPNGLPESPVDYSIGVRFTGMDDGEATRITRMIFQEQMNLRRRGLV
ncbi:MAG: flagellar brake protein [Ignavibacteriales bacterium]